MANDYLMRTIRFYSGLVSVISTIGMGSNAIYASRADASNLEKKAVEHYQLVVSIEPVREYNSLEGYLLARADPADRPDKADKGGKGDRGDKGKGDKGGKGGVGVTGGSVGGSIGGSAGCGKMGEVHGDLHGDVSFGERGGNSISSGDNRR